MTRFTLDSNILVYSADNRDPTRRASALQIIEQTALLDCVLMPQALAEFYAVVSRKQIMPALSAVDQVRDWARIFPVAAGPTAATVLNAAAAAASGRFQFYDALLMATADAAGCTAVISEDMADGARLGSVQVVAAFDPMGTIAPAALALLGG